jgi:SHS2 domain-containing protein
MYETFEHTADLGIRVRADDLTGLFADAARGLFAVLVENIQEAKVAGEMRFQLQADDMEALFHDWLTELLYAFSTRRFILTEFDVQIDAQSLKLSAVARGEPIDLARHSIEAEIKAITWHGLKVERTPTGWTAEAIVDV